MASATLGDNPRHRGDSRPSSRPIWTVVALLVLAVLVVAVVVSARSDRSTEARSPLILLARTPMVDASDTIVGALTLTGSCLSVPAGLVVWPVGTTWDPETQIVYVSHPAEQWKVGDGHGVPGTIVDAIPTTPSSVVTQDAIDALTACSRTTGIRTVAFVG